MTRSSVSTALTAVLALGLTAGAQQPPPPAQDPRQTPPLTFRSITNVVEVDAIVTDRDGAFVRDLRRDEFQILEDGKPVAIGVFSLVDIPVERPDPLLHRESTIEPDVVTNERPVEGRVFVIVLDSYHISPILSAATRKQAQAFVERFLGAHDLAAVVHVGNPAAGQEFTSNRRLLLAAIDRFAGQKLPSATESLIRDARHKASQISPEVPDLGPPEDTQARERAFMARESAGVLRRLAESMTGLSGRRKAVLFFSEGIDYQTVEPPTLVSSDSTAARPTDEAASVRLSQSSMIAAAARANVSFYTISPNGLANEGDSILAIGSMPGQTADIPGARDYMVRSAHTDLGLELRAAHESLRYFAEETGGLAFVSSNDVDASLGRILQDASAYYLLGYVSPDRRRDGRYHRLTVRVTRPGVRVRTRSGYEAPDDEDERPAPVDTLGDLLASPAPLSGLGLHAHAGVVRRPDGRGRVRVTLELTGSHIALRETAGRFVNDVDIGYQAIDATGTTRARGRHVLHLKLLPATRAAFEQQGVRYVTEFDLPPGRYQLRLAAREQAAGKTGSLFYDLEIPAFADLRLAMSDLLITSTAAERTLTGQGAPTIGSRLPSQTTTARTFNRADTISVFAGVYDAEPRPHTLDFTVTVTADDGVKVFSKEDSRASQDPAGDVKELPYTVSIPLQTLPPGRYVLAVAARSRLGESVRKEVEFRVR